MMRVGILLAGFVALLLSTGFQQKKGLKEEEVIARGVEIKVADFKERQMAICKDRALKAAVSKVDSLVRVLARQQAVQPVVKPPKPQRPDKPAIRELPDSLRLDSLKKGH